LPDLQIGLALQAVGLGDAPPLAGVAVGGLRQLLQALAGLHHDAGAGLGLGVVGADLPVAEAELRHLPEAGVVLVVADAAFVLLDAVLADEFARHQWLQTARLSW